VGDNSLYQEEIPGGSRYAALLNQRLELLPQPAALSGAHLLAQALPEAWPDEAATLQAIAAALAARRGYPVPWAMFSRAVDEALNLKLLELSPGSGAWPCSPVTAEAVRVQVPQRIELSAETIVQALKYAGAGAPTLGAIKEVIETQFFGGRSIPTDTFLQRAEAALGAGLLEKVDTGASRDLLYSRVRQPARVLYAEATFDIVALERLAEKVGELFSLAPQMTYTFRVSLTAEGQPLEVETVQRLNKVLAAIRPEWKFS
jgi:hypothetical protein